MKMDIQNAFKYNKITINERCINKNIIYVSEYQLKCKQSTGREMAIHKLVAFMGTI